MRDPQDLDRPAILGGDPIFPEGIPLARPRFRDVDGIAEEIRRLLERGELTNGTHVRRLEAAAAEYLGVRHCVAVSSCTVGLLLVLRAADLSGDVVVPSFTFAATAHAVRWNGLHPVFADVDPETLTLSPASVDRAIGVRTAAILATHVYGTPCDVEGLEAIAAGSGIHLFFDAAHAFGSRRGSRMIGGFGEAEVFSMSPTKVLVAGEGGVIATDDDLLAERCRMGRDYGHPGDYDCRFPGLNGRMSELHALLALDSLSDLEERIERRGVLAGSYRSALEGLPGITFPGLAKADRSTYKDFTILISEPGFGVGAETLSVALRAEGIESKRYYDPPVHRMLAYRTLRGVGPLPVTDRASAEALTLPFWVGMQDEHVFGVVAAIRRIHEVAQQVGELRSSDAGKIRSLGDTDALGRPLP